MGGITGFYIQSCRAIHPKYIQKSIFKAAQRADNRSIQLLAGKRLAWRKSCEMFQVLHQ